MRVVTLILLATSAIAHADPSAELDASDLDFGVLGYLIVGMFLLAWGASVAYWKLGRLDQRFSIMDGSHAHAHTHADGSRHTHDHQHVRLE